MPVDTEVMVLALLVGGVLVMSMQNRQELPPERRRRSDIIAAADPEEMDLTDPTEMRVVEVKKDKFAAWQRSQGWDDDAEMMAKYMLNECTKMIRMQNYFDEALGRPGVVGLYSVSDMAKDLPEEYKNWVAARTYCLNRANEFKNLWVKLNETGETQWLAANTWLMQVPFQVISRLESYSTGVSESYVNLNLNQTMTQVTSSSKWTSAESYARMSQDDKQRLYRRS